MALAAEARPRILVLTDAGGGDKDDLQSLVHLFLYADELDIRAIVSSPPGVGRADDILEVVDRYDADFPRLATHSDTYPSPAYLRSIVHQGHTQAAPKAGYSVSTPGSDALIAEARLASPDDPLWVLVWGSATDLAQALYDAPDIVPNLRVYAIGSWNTRKDPRARNFIIDRMKSGGSFETLVLYRERFHISRHVCVRIRYQPAGNPSALDPATRSRPRRARYIFCRRGCC